ncbi:hypothetical protein CQA53_00445 [Helicobacter didelphidarum]|uniref:Branched-chain amino acid transporter AzlD n=1 Tax=Helicobacter didelphidarum TaxID=2040648 RepID=A0A3D8IRI9_9HELI|nr:AzlD domain-containing protein [Helicobacter didelphidarum]RDU67525.1 hypothetical protein CQA53_00445 [Helicobacter didelphidarum]
MIYITILLIATITALTRFLPFFIFSNRIPNFIIWLGIMLPPSLIAMVLIYSCKDIISSLINPDENFSNGIIGVVGIIIVLSIHILSKNILLSIIGGTLIYLLICNFQNLMLLFH